MLEGSDWIALGVGAGGLVVGAFGAVVSVLAYRVSRRATVASESSAQSSERSADASVKAADAAVDATGLQRSAWLRDNSADILLRFRHAEGPLRYRFGQSPRYSFFEVELANRGRHPAFDLRLTVSDIPDGRNAATFDREEPLADTAWTKVVLRVDQTDPILMDLPQDVHLRITYTDGMTDHELQWKARITGVFPDLKCAIQPGSYYHEAYEYDETGQPIAIPVEDGRGRP